MKVKKVTGQYHTEHAIHNLIFVITEKKTYLAGVMFYRPGNVTFSDVGVHEFTTESDGWSSECPYSPTGRCFSKVCLGWTHTDDVITLAEARRLLQARMKQALKDEGVIDIPDFGPWGEVHVWTEAHQETWEMLNGS